MLGTIVLGRLGGLRALGLGVWGLRMGVGRGGRQTGSRRAQEDHVADPHVPAGSAAVLSLYPPRPSSAPPWKSWGSGRCQGPSSMEGLEEGVFPLKSQPQIVLCLWPPNSAHLFLFLWPGFLYQRWAKHPSCSFAVNGLSRGLASLPGRAVHTGNSAS